MEWMRLSDFAAKHGITYESARKLAAKHRQALQGHVITDDRTRYYDEWAVNYLEEQRKRAKTVYVREEQTEELERQRAQIEAQQTQIAELQGKLAVAMEEMLKLQASQIEAQQQVIEMQKEARPALELRELLEKRTEELTAAQNALEAKGTELQATQKELEELREEDGYIISTLRKERDEAKTEADSFRPSLFGFYRKK